MLEPSSIIKRVRFAKPKPEIALQNKFRALETHDADPERPLKSLRVFKLLDFVPLGAKHYKTKAETKINTSEAHRKKK